MTPSSPLIYTKTGAGLSESSGKTNYLSDLDKSVLAKVDGKADCVEIGAGLALNPDHVSLILLMMQQSGFVKPFHTELISKDEDDDEFDASFLTRRHSTSRGADSSDSSDSEGAIHLTQESKEAHDAQGAQEASLARRDRAPNSSPSVNPHFSDTLEQSHLLNPSHHLVIDLTHSKDSNSDRYRDLESHELHGSHLEPSESEASKAHSIGYINSALNANTATITDIATSNASNASSQKTAEAPSPGELPSGSTSGLDLKALHRAAKARYRAKVQAGHGGQAALKERQAREKERLAFEKSRAEAAAAAEAIRLDLEYQAQRAAEEEASRLRAEELRLEREEQELQRAKLEEEERAAAAAEATEREVREKQRQAELTRLAGIERAKARRLGIFQARARKLSTVCIIGGFILFGCAMTQLIKVSPSECSSEMSRWLGREMEVKECYVSLFPSPHIQAQGIKTVDQSMAAGQATLKLYAPSLLWGAKRIEAVDIRDAALTSDGLAAALSVKRLPFTQGGWIEHVNFTNTTLSAGPLVLTQLNGQARYLSNGSLESVRFTNADEDLFISAKLLKDQPVVSFEAKLPTGSAMGQRGFSAIFGSGVIVTSTKTPTVQFDELSLRHRSGILQSQAKAVLNQNAWELQGSLQTRALNAAAAFPWIFTEGRSHFTGQFNTKGNSFEALWKNFKATASGTTEGALLKVDLGPAMGMGQTVGLARFKTVDMNISYQVSEGIFIRDAKSQAGSLLTQWNATRSPNGQVRGSFYTHFTTMESGGTRLMLEGDDQHLVLKPF